jgi:uncharacterized C2H2 Zn-finger protein
MIYKCPECDYLSTLKSNLTRHCIRKHHSSNLQNGENVQFLGANGCKINPNGCKINPNGCEIIPDGSEINSNGSEINTDNDINNHDNYKCNKCNKILSCNKTYKVHINKCKGILNPLECQFCKTIFSAPSGKSRHLKTCKSKELTTINNSNTTINNNTINNSGTINTNTNSNNVTNITIIAFKPEDQNNIEFVTNHITNPQLKEILELSKNSDSGDTDMIESYMRLLLTNPENRCIKKTNMRSIHSKVHVGENKWQTKHDKEIYPKLTCDIANDFDKVIKQRREDDKTLISKQTLKEVEQFLDYMSDKGYCNDTILGKEMEQTFHEIKLRFKAAIYDTTIT